MKRIFSCILILTFIVLSMTTFGVSAADKIDSYSTGSSTYKEDTIYIDNTDVSFLAAINFYKGGLISSDVVDSYVASAEGLTDGYCFSEWVGVDGRVQTASGQYACKAVGYYWTETQTTRHIVQGVKYPDRNTYWVNGI